MQLNTYFNSDIFVDPVNSSNESNKQMVIPVLWFNQHVEMKSHFYYISIFIIILTNLIYRSDIILYLVSLLIIGTSVPAYYHCKRRNYHSSTVNSESNTSDLDNPQQPLLASE